MQDYEVCAERRSMSEALEKQKDKDVEQQGMMVTPPGMAGVQEGEVKELKKQLAASIWENESSSSTWVSLMADSLQEELRIANGKVSCCCLVVVQKVVVGGAWWSSR